MNRMIDGEVAEALLHAAWTLVVERGVQQEPLFDNVMTARTASQVDASHRESDY